MVNHEKLAQILVEFSRTLVTEYDVSEMLAQVCERCIEVLPVSGAGVMLQDESGDLRFVAASDDTIEKIEALQVEFDEGPCLQAYRTGESVVVRDLAEGGWFPRFTPKALEAGLRAVSSFPMRTPVEVIGALNFYRSEPADLDESERTAAQALTDVATAYILNARTFEESTRLAEQLQSALDSRILIEQAKGRLAEQTGLSMEQAFERMRRHARDRGLKLRRVAQAIVDGRLRIGEREPEHD